MSLEFLAELDRLIESRRGADPGESYTARLLDAGIERVAQKVGEEGVETALALVTRDADGVLDEAADLLYHLLVALRARGVGLSELTDRLAARRR